MVRFTDLHCVVDTHITPRDDTEQEEVANILIEVLERLDTRDGYRAALAMDDPSKLKRVIMMGGAVERGEKYGRLHAHFNLSIMHEGKFLLGEANARLANWFNDQFPWRTACFASVELLESSRTKNYNAKSSRTIDHVAAERERDSASE